MKREDAELLMDVIYNKWGEASEELHERAIAALERVLNPMIYVIIATEYHDSESYEKFVTLVESDADPDEVIEKWRAAKWKANREWEKANPQPRMGTYPGRENDDDAAWLAYAKAERAKDWYRAANVEFNKALDDTLGADKIDALIKAGFKLVEHEAVSL